MFVVVINITVVYCTQRQFRTYIFLDCKRGGTLLVCRKPTRQQKQCTQFNGMICGMWMLPTLKAKSKGFVCPVTLTHNPSTYFSTHENKCLSLTCPNGIHYRALSTIFCGCRIGMTLSEGCVLESTNYKAKTYVFDVFQ